MLLPLQASLLKRTYATKEIPEETIVEGRPLKAIIGQERAVRALQFGLGNKSPGFNVFVSGHPGEDTMEAIRHFLEDLAAREERPSDWCYVNNFEDPYCPRRLKLPPGMARSFKNDIRKFMEEAQHALIAAFESDEFADKREEVNKIFQKKERELFKGIQEKAQEDNFIIKRTPLEIVAVPLVDNKAMTDEEFFQLPKEEREVILEKQEVFQKDLKVVIRRKRELDRNYAEAAYDLEQRIALLAIDTLLEELEEKYAEEEEVLAFLKDLKQNMLDNLAQFLGGQQPQNPTSQMQEEAFLNSFDVNILVDNGQGKGAPIVFELNPTYNNLFGKVEKESYMGALVTDFTLIRPGSLHAANGGYLVLPVEELLMDYSAWEGLKRALRNRRIVIEDAGERFSFISTKSLKPEPIPLDLQVILIGRAHYFYWLYEWDDDFQDLFKVKADFDSTMLSSTENIRDFVGFIYHHCKEEELLPISREGVIAVLEYAHRMAEHQERLSLHFGKISDLLQEAGHYASRKQLKEIDRSCIRQAIEEQRFRSNLWETKMQEYVKEGVVLIDVESLQVGQLNGLSVIDMGDVSFGRPSRITVSLSVGKEGIVDIEREAKLGGSLHTKGILILTGYLNSIFGRDKSLSLSAQLVFEQSYSEIDGDSASCAELMAILSALADLPIRQGIAVTGSVNQNGQVQAVGGINEKIEGFFDLCRERELTGKQGVIIPQANVKSLSLKDDVIQAVEKGDFHIWAIQKVEEGVEILMGLKAGKIEWRADKGKMHFEPSSVFDRVNKRLKRMADIANGEEEEEEEE
jgi:lon-related putative ATP-dependent protease